MTWRDRIRNLFTAETTQGVDTSPQPTGGNGGVMAEAKPAAPEPATPRRYMVLDYSNRPNADQRLNEQIGQWPKWWVKYPEFQRFAQQSDIFRIIANARKREIFRRGVRIKDAEGTDVTGPQPFEQEPASSIEEEYKERKKDLIESFIRQANANDQTLIDVLKELEEDSMTYDDAWLGCQFEYEVDRRSGLVTAKYAKEFFRLHPWDMRMMVDQRNRLGRDTMGNRVYFSITDRESIITETEAKAKNYRDHNGVQLFPAFYKFTVSGTQGNGNVYYAPWEVKHTSYYARTLTYSSCPPLMAVWMKVWTLIKMDEYVMQYYALQRPPKFFLVFNTTNGAALEKEYNAMLQRAAANPHLPGILANESSENTGGVQTVDLMRSLEEMQFTDTRDEFRKQIGAVYGVMPIFHADVETSGGLNKETIQITVTNREMEHAQAHHNETNLYFVTKCIGAFDFRIELEPNEEQDEVAEESRLAMKIQNAQAMLSLGLTVHYDKETGEFSFSGQPRAAQQPMGLPGQPGQPGEGKGGFGMKPEEPPQPPGGEAGGPVGGSPNTDNSDDLESYLNSLGRSSGEPREDDNQA